MIKQILYDMRHQRMMTWVSISGTAIAIFLVMTFIMADDLHTVEVAPAVHRSRIMQGINLHMSDPSDQYDGSTSGLSVDVARKLYDNLDGVEMTSYVMAWDETSDFSLPGEEAITVMNRAVDDRFWKMYDFKFIDGRPFDEAEVKANARMVVLSRSMARQLFGEEMVAGREVEIQMQPFTVVGVVEDTNPILGEVFAKAWRVYDIGFQAQNEWDEMFGNTSVRLLLKPGTDPAYLKSQVKNRYKQLEAEASKLSEGMKPIYHDQPYTAEDAGAGIGGTNTTPDTESQRHTQWIIYAILIILPAINLSSMTRGRLRHRVAEIGVRRAFGARRSDIVRQLFGENLLITLAGGAIGLILSLLFMTFASSFLFTYRVGFGTSLEVLNALPDVGMLFRWGTFFIALGICLVLNILSATVPAWRASLVDPAVALSARLGS